MIVTGDDVVQTTRPLASSSKIKPCSHLVNMQRMQEYQFAFIPHHYLVAMASSLDKLKNKVKIHHLHLKRFHVVKRLRNSVQYIRRYSTKYASFLAVLYLTFSNELHYL